MRGAGQIAELARDRRARRRRDRQRRPGPSRAAGLDRGDRRDEGRADRRACARRDGDRPRRRAAAAPIGRARGRHDRDVRPGRRRRASSRTAWSSPFTQRPHAPQRARRAGRRARRRRRAARAVGGRAERAARPARSSCPAASSSSTTATTPTRCRCAPPSTTSPRPHPDAASPCSGTCSSSGPTRSASTRRSARTRAARASTCWSPSARWPPRWARRSAGETVAVDAAADVVPAVRDLLAPGDTVLVKASRGVGLEVVAQALEGRADGRGPHRRHGVAAHLHLPVPVVHRLPARAASSARTSARRAPRATTPRRARPRWAGSSSSRRSACRS